MKKTSNTIKSSLLLLMAAAIWGISFVAQSVAMDHIGGFTFNGVRSILGALSLIPVMLLFRSGVPIAPPKDAASNRRILWQGGISCGFVLFLASNFQQYGIKYTTVGKAGFITACYIVLVPVFGLFLRKHCSPLVWLAVLLAIAGLYLLCINEEFSIGRGDLLCMICSVLFAVHILIIDHYSPLVNGIQLSCIQFLVCGVLSLIAAFLWENPSLPSLLLAAKPVLYAGILSCGLGYTAQILGQRDISPTIASLILSLESCISVLSGWLLLGQTLSSRELLGCLIMFFAILMAQIPVPGKNTSE